MNFRMGVTHVKCASWRHLSVCYWQWRHEGCVKKGLSSLHCYSHEAYLNCQLPLLKALKKSILYMSHIHLSVHNRCIWKRCFFALGKAKFLYVKSFYIRFALVKGIITSSAAKPEAGRNMLTLEGTELQNNRYRLLYQLCFTAGQCWDTLGLCVRPALSTWAITGSTILLAK